MGKLPIEDSDLGGGSKKFRYVSVRRRPWLRDIGGEENGGGKRGDGKCCDVMFQDVRVREKCDFAKVW